NRNADGSSGAGGAMGGALICSRFPAMLSSLDDQLDTGIETPGHPSRRVRSCPTAGRSRPSRRRSLAPPSGDHEGARVMPINIFTTFDDPQATLGTVAEGINGSGQIVGFFKNGNLHGFVLSGGSFITLDDPSATGPTEAFGINDTGRIVGSFRDGSGGTHGFLRSGSIFNTLDDPSAPIRPEAVSINDTGQIVGDYFNATGNHGFLLSGGVFSTLDDPLATTNGTSAHGINNAGQIVGTYFDAGGEHGFLLSGGVFTTLDDPLATNTQAFGIND